MMRRIKITERPHTIFINCIKKNIAISGITSLFIGIFLAFFVEYVGKVRKQIRGQS